MRGILITTQSHGAALTNLRLSCRAKAASEASPRRELDHLVYRRRGCEGLARRAGVVRVRDERHVEGDGADLPTGGAAIQAPLIIFAWRNTNEI